MGNKSSSDIDRLLHKIARGQMGLVTTRQAASVGVGNHALTHRRSVGLLVPVFPQVMRLAAAEASSQQRTLAAALAVPSSVVAGPSAGFILGLPVGGPYGHRSADVVLSVASAKTVDFSGLRVVRQGQLLPSRPWFGALLATPAAALVMLPRFNDARTVERCLDHCLAHRLVTVESVRLLIESRPSRSVTGRAMLLDLLAARCGGIGHRSMKEQRVDTWLTRAGLRGWRRNYVVIMPDGTRVEVDFGWPEHKVALEVSPFFTHGSRATQERDVVRRRLLVHMGWTVVEATDPDLVDEAAFQRVAKLLWLLAD